jgi:hypothetical protein
VSSTVSRLEIILGGCREPIPARFHRTFEGSLFDSCGYCHALLLTGDTYYTICKLYSGGQLQAEIAVCRACQSQLKQGYSQESLHALKTIYSEDYSHRRLGILFEIREGEDRVKKMLAHCSICSTPREEIETYFEYALCEQNQLVFYTHPSLVCEACTLRIYNSLSEQTRDHKRRFMQEHFGFPPPGSDTLKADVHLSKLWLLA